MNPIIGIDSCIDEDGKLQPWKVVIFHQSIPDKTKTYLMALKPGIFYIPEAFDQHYGDLTLLQGKRDSVINEICRDLIEMGFDRVYVDLAHLEGDFARTLNWNGIRMIPVKIDLPEDLIYENFHNIGGMAGHEISQIKDILVREQV